jgi:hypothetical protein
VRLQPPHGRQTLRAVAIVLIDESVNKAHVHLNDLYCWSSREMLLHTATKRHGVRAAPCHRHGVRGELNAKSQRYGMQHQGSRGWENDVTSLSATRACAPAAEQAFSCGGAARLVTPVALSTGLCQTNDFKKSRARGGWGQH